MEITKKGNTQETLNLNGNLFNIVFALPLSTKQAFGSQVNIIFNAQ